MDVNSYKGVENGKVAVSEPVKTPDKKKIILNAFVMNTPNHLNPGLWRHPDNQQKNWNDLDYWVNLAQLLEKGKFHAMFVADTAGIYDVYKSDKDTAVRTGTQYPVNDPLYLVPALSLATKNIGFGITVSTTYDVPYALARRFATVDHLSKGRVAWNIVTSYLESGALNHGLDHQVPHDERYNIADEYLDVTYKLWESSWREDALKKDVEANVLADPELVKYINHKGKYFKVPGPAITSPSPQRTPFLFQAGMSTAGRKFASKHAEAVFVAGPTPQFIRKSVDDLREQVSKLGRDPQSIKAIPVVFAIVAETDELARQKYDDYFSYVDPEGALALFGGWFGLDVSKYPDDLDLRKVTDNDTLVKSIEQWAASSNDSDGLWNKWRVAKEFAIGGRGDVIIGSPATVADRLEEWVEVGDVDGFNLANAIIPGTYEAIIELLIPELQKRGRFWEDYAVPGGTLRENVFATPGLPHLRDDHPAKKYTWKKDEPFPLDEEGNLREGNTSEETSDGQNKPEEVTGPASDEPVAKRAKVSV
ncbi:luciferase-like domain-containing protein [Yarrowia lipolytica]|jgi:FMN-dependent oxidoreductase (nitrilotriacetate monooxygenase family)|uniref:YALI0E19943p n=2 Tax=Yarrowia lipolytica TaxID=4952 RepID=Q6C596_YARLI|nr:YALI0E19943p [Yarrowia lipolytica CLIB122]RDW22786.1 luciferase-like domain-containing protein [Yarrowia lipolytica]RDW29552.1 luciferase-like domain-containing protein [Yarrowia lipolytica]RDW36353.1 luciferase-like domain-containing protein [Yarrowia lipolytica]RDW43326.1 luciferase-like domain-containing protein [Yarrowia lipolytica]RDW50092.1 luciferase-like domain-containing protein [Yarrowia lipolytica]|eukprot:XP_504166.1 YALI0E19943p [Yarrowia lipolytica CLIB122]